MNISIKYFILENNDIIASFYLLLDKYLYFFNKGVSKLIKSILEIEVAAILKDIY